MSRTMGCMSLIPAQDWSGAPALPPPADVSADAAARLTDVLARLRTQEQLAHLVRHDFPGRIALVSSFGAEAAVLLHMIAAVDPAVPVLFLDTGKLFGETLRYRDLLIDRLGLKDVRSIVPQAGLLNVEDPKGVLWRDDPDRCCFLRKVEPLERALVGFGAWINGRKRYHGGE